MKTTDERLTIATEIADMINNTVSYASGRFTARAWCGGNNVRIYWCNGYAVINNDGSVDIDNLKRSQYSELKQLLNI